MPDLIDRQEAIRILDSIRASHAKRTCSRTDIIQATAFEYAIEVIKKLPQYEDKDQ